MRLLLLVAFLSVAFASRVSYEGYKVYRLTPTANQFALLKVYRNLPGFEFWNEPHKVGAYLDMMVSPSQQSHFLDFLEEQKMHHTVLFENLQTAIDAEELHQRLAVKKPRAISFDQYYRYDDINSYLQELASNYPNLVTLQSIGKSYEGRDMIVIKISSGGSGSRPAILIDGGIHAREWIAPAMALYIINQLVENNAANSDLTDAVDWYILPVLNPDGYEYSFTSDRMWRKTRSPTSISSCPGVDGNRNFGFHWMEVGASDYPCYEDYGGEEAFSEIETQNLRDFALSNKDQIKLYLTFHSYGGYLLYPWGYTSDLPSDWRTLQDLAEQADDAHVAAGGESYSIGTSTNVLYAAAGGSDDYMKGVAGVALSYTVELTDTWYGFELPASMIEPTVTRFFAAVRVFGNYVKNNF
ncbi:carboxypeptidase B-like [Periplaneta americana]|uniref:carboxypeptidase B-like n=1 Tax=Periplaneta americana TaxID=6978 RepID=UPI0037E84ACA